MGAIVYCNGVEGDTEH